MKLSQVDSSLFIFSLFLFFSFLSIIDFVGSANGVPDPETRSKVPDVFWVMEVMVSRICLRGNQAENAPGELVPTVELMPFKNSPSVVHDDGHAMTLWPEQNDSCERRPQVTNHKIDWMVVLSRNRNVIVDLMVLLVNVFVEILVVEQPVWPVKTCVLAENQEVELRNKFVKAWQLLFSHVDSKSPGDLPVIAVADDREAYLDHHRTVEKGSREGPDQDPLPPLRLFVPRPRRPFLGLELLEKWDLQVVKWEKEPVHNWNV